MRPQPKNHLTESSYKNYIETSPIYGNNIGGSSKFTSTKAQNFL